MNHKNGSVTNIFLAVEFDDDTKQLLARKLFLLDYKDYLRTEPKRNFHITLGYIREVHETQRREIINAFKPLKEHHPFTAHVEAPIIFGAHHQMLCVRHSPFEMFDELHTTAKALLSEHTQFKFDEKHPTFIPHTKIQTVRRSTSHEMRDEIVFEFNRLNMRKLDFKVKSLALMHRIDKDYITLYRYELKKPGSPSSGHEEETQENLGRED